MGHLWAKLHTATGKTPHQVLAHPQPVQEAERLVYMFVSWDKSNQVPTHVRQLQDYVRAESRAIIDEARNRADVIDRRELVLARRKRDTAAGGAGVNCSMLAHAGLGKEEAVLAVDGGQPSICMEGCQHPTYPKTKETRQAKANLPYELQGQ